MWLPALTTVTPSGEPISIDEAKAHLRVDGTDEQPEITSLIAAARGHVEKITGTRLLTQTVSVSTDRWCDLACLPLGPVQSISSVTYLDANSVSQTLATDQYEAVLRGLGGEIRRALNVTWPTIRCVSNAITVTMVVGYGAAAAVPGEIRAAMLLLAGHWFANREAAGGALNELPIGVDALLSNHRRYAF